MHTLALHDHNHQEARETPFSFEHERKKRVLTLYHTLWQSKHDHRIETMKEKHDYGRWSSKLSRLRSTSRWRWRKGFPTLSHSPLFSYWSSVHFHPLIWYFKTLSITITVPRRFARKKKFIYFFKFFSKFFFLAQNLQKVVKCIFGEANPPRSPQNHRNTSRSRRKRSAKPQDETNTEIALFACARPTWHLKILEL